ncbi:leucyl aminopeptidase [Spiroplasma sp. TIUS-1]|uniref:M17 family metallopeptidase n=1 Tax=Spiroplasma sp. TIUS-1 TaxID=216963 RepID=UPI0013986495|nr:M17 family metallopeptidase [Spiroplasma sp. TIUS-1]QHX36186.1 leucyl aminopeptidase [Spiroplasma sp. TIUS-1]
MIFKNNNKSFDITLKAICSSDNAMVVKTPGAITLISEEKTIYLFLNEKTSLRKLENIIKTTFTSLPYNVNVDIESFLCIKENDKEIFQVVVEAIMFANNPGYVLKKDAKKHDRDFNIVFNNNEFDAIFNSSEIKMEFVNFARNLQDLPPNIGTSVEIANMLVEKAKGIAGLKVTVYNKKQIEQLKMGLLLGVNAGSSVEARVVVMEYSSDSSIEKTAYIGKGICFDSGGYNLKGSQFLKGMKFDMSGAAIVCSSVMALAKAKAKSNVIAVACLTDNRIGSSATLTESVLTSMNGTTVEIGNTDAEGRLVLADGITLAIRKFGAEKVVDVATLTGAIVIALGAWFTGSFSTNDEYYKEFEIAHNKAIEYVWRQPVIEEHFEVMQKASKIADLNNSETSRQAGSSTAAAFLNHFAEGKPYIHLDIAATDATNDRGDAPMLKTLFELGSK